jgi:hypothetical protein
MDGPAFRRRAIALVLDDRMGHDGEGRAILLDPSPAALDRLVEELARVTEDPNRYKPTVKQNQWGNWNGYVNGRKVREFPADVSGPLVGTTTVCGATNGPEMPEAARAWLETFLLK